LGGQSYDNPQWVHVIYSFFPTAAPDQYEEIRYARSTDGGRDFPDRVTLSDPNDVDEAWTPSIATYGFSGQGYSVIANYFDEDSIGREGHRYSILQRQSRDRGLTWGQRNRLTGLTVRDCVWPSLATTRRPPPEPTTVFYEHHIYCEEDADDYMQVTYERIERDMFDDSPDPEFIERVLTQGPVDRSNPCIAASPGEWRYIYAVWSDDSTNVNNEEVWLRRSTDGGQTWVLKRNISETPNYESQAPCVAACSTTVLVAWQEENPADRRFRIMFRRSYDSGESWSDPVCLTADLPSGVLHNRPPECFTPSLAIYYPYAYLVFQAGWDTPAPGYGVMFMMSTDLGGTWEPAYSLGGWTDNEPDLDEGNEGLFPTISVSQGTRPVAEKYLNVVYSGKPPASSTSAYQVYYLRGNDITSTTPPDGGQSAGWVGLPTGVGFRVWPNPAESDVCAELELARPSDVELALYDIQGRQVRELAADKVSAGRHSFRFDLTGHSGERLSAGTYMLVLQTSAGTEVRRLQVVRR